MRYLELWHTSMQGIETGWLSALLLIDLIDSALNGCHCLMMMMMRRRRRRRRTTTSATAFLVVVTVCSNASIFSLTESAIPIQYLLFFMIGSSAIHIQMKGLYLLSHWVCISVGQSRSKLSTCLKKEFNREVNSLASRTKESVENLNNQVSKSDNVKHVNTTKRQIKVEYLTICWLKNIGWTIPILEPSSWNTRRWCSWPPAWARWSWTRRSWAPRSPRRTRSPPSTSTTTTSSAAPAASRLRSPHYRPRWDRGWQKCIVYIVLRCSHWKQLSLNSQLTLLG